MADFLRRLLLILIVLLTTILSEIAFILATVATTVWPKTGYARWLLLGHIALTRFRLGLWARSKRFASELLAFADRYPDDWNCGNAVHRANILLGRIALKEQDVEAAKRFLIAAGRTAGSPQLDSFGPNMSLAKELLELGETAVVLDYFKLCSTFWAEDFSRLKHWENDIRFGRKPFFGPNLYY